MAWTSLPYPSAAGDQSPTISQSVLLPEIQPAAKSTRNLAKDANLSIAGGIRKPQFRRETNTGQPYAPRLCRGLELCRSANSRMVTDTIFPQNQRMPEHIGIVACSAEGAALCYRTICTEGAQVLGAHAHPEVSIHTPSLAEYVKWIDRGDWQRVGELMLASAHKLAAIGANFLICPDNTIHQALPFVEPRSPLPWVHIAEVVATRAAERGFRCLGLIGTRSLVESDVYPKKLAAHGLGFVRPDATEREGIHRIIMDELVYGIVKPEAVAYHQRVIRRLKSEGSDAVVLGCTEIPLIMDDSNSPLPTLDSTRLLARAALRRAVGSAEGPA